MNKTYMERFRKNLYRVEFQKLVSRVSFDFVSVTESNLEERIKDLLRRVGEFFNLNRAYVCLLDSAQASVTSTYAWVRDQTYAVESAVPEGRLANYPWWVKQLRESKFVRVGDVREMPPAAEKEKALLESLNVKSTAVLPIEEDGKFVEFMGLECTSTVRQWSDYQSKKGKPH